MALRVSIVVPPTAADSRRLLTSVDRQSLPASEFEVLVGDDEQDPELTVRLEDLVAHRTNLIRVPVPPGSDVAATLLARAQGEYVVAVGPRRSLTPPALALLCDHADTTGADVCLGLTGFAGRRPDRLPVRPDELAGPAGALRRRAVATNEQVAADLTGADATIDGAASVATSLCFVDGVAPDATVPDATDQSVRARATSIVWRDGILEVVAELSEPVAEVRATIYSHRTGIEWSLAEPGVVGTEVTLRIDVAAVPGPGRLPDGVWWPSLRLGDGRAVLIEAAPKAAQGATLRSRAVVSYAEGQRLALDVGGHTQQPVRWLKAAETTVVEDSRGSLLTSVIGNLDLEPGQRTTGQLRLGKMPVVAWLEVLENGDSALRAWVSGLAGSSPLQTRFGRAPFASSGTELVIDGAGIMTVAPITKQAPAAVPATETVAAGRPADDGSGSPVAKARRLAGRAVRSVRG